MKTITDADRQRIIATISDAGEGVIKDIAMMYMALTGNPIGYAVIVCEANRTGGYHMLSTNLPPETIRAIMEHSDYLDIKEDKN